MIGTARSYVQTARAAASQDLRHRIVTAFHDQLLLRWIDEITLDEVAAAARTTRRTVIRLFGGKAGLLESVIDVVLGRAMPRILLPWDTTPAAAIDALLDHYEATGDITIRFLAQEERNPSLRAPLDEGRRRHRAWVAERFGGASDATDTPEHERQIAWLVVATDVYAWKLWRRDCGYARDDVAVLVAGLINRIVGANLI